MIDWCKLLMKYLRGRLKILTDELKELETRNTGVIYSSMLDQIRKLYKRDKIKAGEYAISAIELILCDDVSSDDLNIEIMLEPFKALNKRNQAKWEHVKESKSESKIAKLQLKEIADLYLSGLKQDKIGEKVGVSRQTVSNRLKLIRTEYPELLKEEEDAAMLDDEIGKDLPGDFLGGTIKVDELNKLKSDYNVVDNFAYFPSTGVRLKIIP